MKISEIKELLDTLYPSELSEKWDNDGDMLVINKEQEVSRVVTTLDVTDKAVEHAIASKAQLIVSHHPMIFNHLSRLDDSALSKRIATLIKANISVLSYHTRFDSANDGMNDRLAKKLSLKNPEPFGFEGEIPMGRIGDFEECTPGEFAAIVSKALGTHVLFYEGNTNVRRVALLGGGGKDFIHLAHTLGADAMVTGDISYSVVMQEKPYGITMVDAGHFATEIIAVEAFAEVISQKLGVEVIRHYDENPCQVVMNID